jgi:indole-3-glycerol phosphate synthase
VNRLTEIVTKRRERVAAAKIAASRDFESQAREVRSRRPAHALFHALSDGDGIKVIAEFKRRSPSKGTIKAEADPPTVARQYERGGASAISVLTEPDYFDGSLDDLRAVRRTTALPVLRKDFIVDQFQIYEAAAAEADALLLIVAALTDVELISLRRITEDELGMDALVEVHTADEMQRAINCGARLIGVNNRNLATFEVSLETSLELAQLAPADRILISESGIETADDINRLRVAGYHGFLIGETLMRAADPAAMIAELTQWIEVANSSAPT